MNKFLRFFLAALLACSALVLTACQGESQNSQKKTYKIGVLRIDDSLPLYTAEEEKLFEKNGVDVQVVEFSSAADQQKAMEAGELDGMMTDMIVTALLKKSGTDLRVVAMALGAVPQEGRFLVVSSPNSNITTPQQLASASVAISENTMMDYLMNQYEAELGIPKEAVHTVQMPNLALRTDAVLSGKDIQAAILPDPLAAYAVQQGAHVVIDDTKLQKNYSQSVVVLTEDMISKHHDDAVHFLAAYNEAIQKLDSQPDAYRDLAMKKANIPAAVAASYRTPSYTAGALPTEEEVSRIMNWMVSKGLLPKAYSYEEMVAHVQ
ncbi:ABC transporter substrate-binding protein [Megasphaera sp.]|uniref:ABC transporter substrate-binding protein n=1 Tax=Megasphaera sp. TaxID=2023260 RepID=UPI0025D70075|nr:ABC transporter substrate-binding protein [uncultured Megasphaera sp.]